MKRALDPYVSRVPDISELASVSDADLSRIVAECREIESATAVEIADTLGWARSVRLVAERSLSARKRG